MEAERSDGVFDAFANKIGVPADQVYFFSAEIFCLVCAILFRNLLPASESNTKLRHIVELTTGIAVGYFCFGSEFLHVVLQSVLCLVGIKFLPPSIMHKYVFTVAMGYLILIHLHRAFITPEDVLYTIDVSGPLMVATQKITSLAFSLADGHHGNKENQSDLRRKHLLKQSPSALEYFSYIFYFQSVLVGPLSFFDDYKAFIEGTNLKQNNINGVQNNNTPHTKSKPRELSPFEPVSKKLCTSLFWIIFHMVMKPNYPESKNADSEFQREFGFSYRVYYMYVSMLCCRAKYYVAFTLGDAICNASGFGFTGYDNSGRPRWDLCTNAYILEIEAATSPKLYLDNWNIQTAVWLRHICYDRLNVQKRFLTFLLSALWHGCYPGYYFTFILGALFSDMARQMRRKFRPYFLGSSEIELGYDTVTLLITQLSFAYMAVPFTLLHFSKVLSFYNSFYWCCHVMLVLLYIVMPFIPTPKTGTSNKDTGIKVNNGPERQIDKATKAE